MIPGSPPARTSRSDQSRANQPSGRDDELLRIETGHRLRRHAGDDAERFDVVRHDRMGTNDGPVTNPHTGQQSAVGGEPHVVFHDHRAGIRKPGPVVEIVERIVLNGDMRGDLDPVADLDPGQCRKAAPGVHVHLATEHHRRSGARRKARCGRRSIG